MAFDPAAPVVLSRSVIQRNTVVDNGTSGIVLNRGSVNNRLLANTSSRNLRGILLSGATGTTVLANALTENRQVDARDVLPDQNTWLGNRCATDDPAGVLCVPPGDRSH
ncbi:MAG TPA: NosD domain-containing protein [Microlunatus sp.]|nr:NosD domain-containing protein [Microlunatus sp.]